MPVCKQLPLSAPVTVGSLISLRQQGRHRVGALVPCPAAQKLCDLGHLLFLQFDALSVN